MAVSDNIVDMAGWTPKQRSDALQRASDAIRAAPDKLRLNGVGRDTEAPGGAVTVFFNRPLTDDELRFFHEVCGRTVPLMEGR